MNIEETDTLYQRSAFLWAAGVTAALLLIPLLAMQFTSEVNWTLADFVAMGVLLFAAGSVFVLVARRIQRKHRILLGVVLSLVFLAVWVELAVGVFTNLGS